MPYTWLSNLSLWMLIAAFAIAITCAWLSDINQRKW